MSTHPGLLDTRHPFTALGEEMCLEQLRSAPCRKLRTARSPGANSN
ncbi:hypothetical protein LEMLEM_LOCUS10452 [Lemmus lemmus]